MVSAEMTSEPTFGIIKEQMYFRRFSCRGLSLAGAEWLVVSAAYNIKRLYVLTRAGAMLALLKAKEAGNSENSAILLRNTIQRLYHAWHTLVTQPFTPKLYTARHFGSFVTTKERPRQGGYRFNNTGPPDCIERYQYDNARKAMG